MERTGRTVAKRPHKKSKNGCRTCRTRRVKCDEVHPLCGPCRKHCICCYYDRPDPNARSRQLTRSPSTSSISTVDLVTSERIELRESTTSGAAWMRPPPWFGCPDKRVLDLQLMNFYTYVSTTGRPETSARMRYVWAYEVPQKALACDYLMYSLLSYAALYIHIRNPFDVEICEVSHAYFGKAVACLRQMVALVDDSNAEYVFAASQLIYIQCALQWLDPCNRDEPYQLPMQWLTMGHGVGSVLRDRVPAISRTSMNVMLQKPPARDPVRNAEFIIDNVKRMITYDETPDVFSMKKVLMYLKCLYEAVQNETVAYGRQRILLFPIILDAEFFKMLHAHDPRALIAMIFYFAAMKNLEGHWWYDGRAKHEVTGIAAMLPEQYKYNIAWPLETIEGRNTGIPDWDSISSCIPIELGDLDSKIWYR